MHIQQIKFNWFGMGMKENTWQNSIAFNVEWLSKNKTRMQQIYLYVAPARESDTWTNCTSILEPVIRARVLRSQICICFHCLWIVGIRSDEIFPNYKFQSSKYSCRIYESLLCGHKTDKHKGICISVGTCLQALWKLSNLKWTKIMATPQLPSA